MFRGKKLAIYYLGLLGVLLVLAFIGGYLMTKNQGQPEAPITVEEEETAPAGEGVTYYSATENILPLGRDTDSRNFGMKKQIKGVIEEWQVWTCCQQGKTYGAWMVSGSLLDVSGRKMMIPEG